MKNFRYLTLITQLGIDIISGIAVGMILGMLLDKWLKTNNIFTIILMLFGIFSGLNLAYRRLQLFIKKNDRKKDNKKDDKNE